MRDCLNPVDVWKCGTCVCKSDGVLSSRLVFNVSQALRYYESIYPQPYASKVMEENRFIQPCGKCPACLIRKRKEMAIRLSHETKMAKDCCFITLTYNDDNVPRTDFQKWGSTSKLLERGDGPVIGTSTTLPLPELTLLPSDVQKFMKRLRRHLEYLPKKVQPGRDHVTTPIRYFAVGEYGTKTKRPHYHIIIFGWKPSDGYVKELRNGYAIYRSPQLEKLWSFGFSTYANVNVGVAKYCARYVTKKYARLSTPDDFSDCICPEFTLQSTRNGGIGATWFDLYGCDSLKNFFVTVDSGKYISKCSVPRYYWSRLRKKHLPLWLKLRDEKIAFIDKHPPTFKTFDEIMRSVNVAKEVDKYQAEKEIF